MNAGPASEYYNIPNIPTIPFTLTAMHMISLIDLCNGTLHNEELTDPANRSCQPRNIGPYSSAVSKLPKFKTMFSPSANTGLYWKVGHQLIEHTTVRMWKGND